MLPNWGYSTAWIPLLGNDRNDTALIVARAFFGGFPEAAFATSTGWPDALSGGAMIGHLGGPLLLTTPDTLYGPDGAYVKEESDAGSLLTVDVLGGPGALLPAIPVEIGAQLGDPAHVVISAKHAPHPTGTQVDASLVTVTREG